MKTQTLLKGGSSQNLYSRTEATPLDHWYRNICFHFSPLLPSLTGPYSSISWTHSKFLCCLLGIFYTGFPYSPALDRTSRNIESNFAYFFCVTVKRNKKTTKTQMTDSKDIQWSVVQVISNYLRGLCHLHVHRDPNETVWRASGPTVSHQS